MRAKSGQFDKKSLDQKISTKKSLNLDIKVTLLTKFLLLCLNVCFLINMAKYKIYQCFLTARILYLVFAGFIPHPKPLPGGEGIK